MKQSQTTNPIKDVPFQTIRSAVAPTGLSERYIRQLYREGKLPHIMIGNRVLVDVPALIDYVHQQAAV